MAGAPDGPVGTDVGLAAPAGDGSSPVVDGAGAGAGGAGGAGDAYVHPPAQSLFAAPSWFYGALGSGWGLLEQHGWTMVVVGIVLFVIWMNIRESVLAALRSAHPQRRVTADPEAVLRARAAQQAKVEDDIRLARQRREADRRAAVTGDDSEATRLPKKKSKPVVRRGYGGGSDTGHSPLMGYGGSASYRPTRRMAGRGGGGG